MTQAQIIVSGAYEFVRNTDERALIWISMAYWYLEN